MSRRAWRWTLFVWVTTVAATGLSLIAILTRPDARRADPIWSDDFDDTQGAWTIEPPAGGSISEGRLLLQPIRPDLPTLAMRPLPLGDFVAETQASAIGSTDNGYGIVAGNAGELTAFLVSGDGYFSVRQQSNGGWIDILPWKEWPHIRRGEADNTLRVECRGDTCAFYVNEEFAAQIDVRGERTIIGVMVWRYTTETSVGFQYVRVWRNGT